MNKMENTDLLVKIIFGLGAGITGLVIKMFYAGRHSQKVESKVDSQGKRINGHDQEIKDTKKNIEKDIEKQLKAVMSEITKTNGRIDSTDKKADAINERVSSFEITMVKVESSIKEAMADQSKNLIAEINKIYKDILSNKKGGAE